MELIFLQKKIANDIFVANFICSENYLYKYLIVIYLFTKYITIKNFFLLSSSE